MVALGLMIVQVNKDACPKQKKMKSTLNIHYHDVSCCGVRPQAMALCRARMRQRHLMLSLACDVNVAPKRQDSRFFGDISCDVTTEIAAKAMPHNATPLQNVTD